MKERNEVLHTLFLILQVGITMLVTFGLCFAIGFLLDKNLGSHLLWVFIVLGILSGYRILVPENMIILNISRFSAACKKLLQKSCISVIDIAGINSLVKFAGFIEDSDPRSLEFFNQLIVVFF